MTFALFQLVNYTEYYSLIYLMLILYLYDLHKVFKGIKFTQRMEEKKEHVHNSSKNAILDNIRKNPWIIVSAVLVLVLIVVAVFGSSGVSGQKAAQNLVSYINSLGQGDATLVNVTKSNGLYLVNVNFQDQVIPVYVSLDGKYLIPDVVPLVTVKDTSGSDTAAASKTVDVPKSDKPKVELFVMAYCPY